MDSLTRDVERIFNQNRDENEENRNRKKSVVYRAAEYMFDISVLVAIYAALTMVVCMAVILIGRAGKAFFTDRRKRKKRN